MSGPLHHVGERSSVGEEELSRYLEKYEASRLASLTTKDVPRDLQHKHEYSLSKISAELVTVWSRFIYNFHTIPPEIIGDDFLVDWLRLPTPFLVELSKLINVTPFVQTPS